MNHRIKEDETDGLFLDLATLKNKVFVSETKNIKTVDEDWKYK